MTESRESQGSEFEELTVLVVLSAEAEAGDDRQYFLAALDSLGFVRGPVVGDICAVTGPRDQVVALCDHAAIMHLDATVAGASGELLALMRPAVKDIVFDDPVETFTEAALPTTGGTNDIHHDEPPYEGMD